MDERGDSREKTQSENKPDDETKEKPKDENGPTEEEAAAASSQPKPNPSIPFSMADYAAVVPGFMAAYQGVKTLCSGSANQPAAASSGYAAVVPAFMAAYQGVKTLYSGSANKPAAASSANNQVNQGEVGQPSTSPMVAGSSPGFANVRSHIGRFVGFSFGANPPVTNSQVNQLDHPPTPPMATPSSAGSANDLSHTESSGSSTSAARPLVTRRQVSQSEVDKAATSPEENASSSGLANFRSQVSAFSYDAIQKAAEMIPFHSFGPLKTVSADKPQKAADNGKPKKTVSADKPQKAADNGKPKKTVSADKPQKEADNGKPKKEKRKKKKQGAAKPSKHIKGDGGPNAP